MTISDPAAQDAPFALLGSEHAFRGHVIGVRVDRLRGQDGREATREVVEHPGAVGAVVTDETGRVLLVEQWRQAMGRRTLEIPAGKYDVPGESSETALRRELAEELGVEGGTATLLTSFATTPGWSDEHFDLYLVERTRPILTGRPPVDWEEADLRVVALPPDEALRVATAGRQGDAKTIVALGLYTLLRGGAWQPHPNA